MPCEFQSGSCPTQHGSLPLTISSGCRRTTSGVGTDRLPSRDARGFYRGAPDLAIEVRSPDEAPAEIHDKVGNYLAAGTPMVVVIDPAPREVSIHRPGTSPAILGVADMLHLGPVVSGFSVPVQALFE